jgi:hypothetical protein
METELSEIDFNICMLAVMKCHLLHQVVEIGLPCSLNSKNFGFPELTDEEESVLIEKLYKASQLAWLKTQREDSDGNKKD